MKKKLVASLAAAMVLGVAGTSFAAANPFVDVPAKHWAYASVAKLAQAGIVDGYGDGTYLGDKMISRYEMAQIVAKAMARSDKADAAQKAIIDQLSVEFASELEGLNVRVTKVENKVDKFDISGTARIRYDHIKNDNTASAKNGVQNQNINLDLFYGYKVNQDWSIQGESEYNRDLRHSRLNSGNNDEFEQLYVTGPIAGTKIKAGKFSYLPTYGVLFDGKISGAQVAFGNVLKTTLNVGKTDDVFVNGATRPDSKIEAVDFVWAYNKDTNIKANYIKGTDTADHSVKYYEAGFDKQLSKDFAFQAAYAKSDLDTLNKAAYAQVQYKAADLNVVGSNDFYVGYRKYQPNATIKATGDWLNNDETEYKGFKGVRIGYDYVPMKNAKFATWYQTGKTATGVNDVNVKTFRAQVELSF